MTSKSFRALKVNIPGRTNNRRGYWTGTGINASTNLNAAFLFGPLADINPNWRSLSHEGRNPEVVYIPTQSLSIPSTVVPSQPSTTTVQAFTVIGVGLEQKIYVASIALFPNSNIGQNVVIGNGAGSYQFNGNSSLDVSIKVTNNGGAGNAVAGTVIPVGTTVANA